MLYANYAREKLHNLILIKEARGYPCVFLKSKGKNLKDYKIYGNSVQIKVPDEYQQVEYIEATGEQYLEIDYIASGITSSKGKYQITDVSTAKMLFGSRPHAGAENTYAFNWGGGLPYRLYNSYSTPVQSTLAADTNIHTFYKDKGYFYLDGVLIHSKEEKNFVTPYKMIVFGCNTGNVRGLFAPAKLYYLQFYDNDTLMVDLVPCYRKSDNVIGMYDTVNGVFYENKGTGTFIKGNDTPSVYIPLEVESVGERTKNLININAEKGSSVTVEGNSLVVNVYGGNSSASTGATLGELCPMLEVGKTYVISYLSKVTDANISIGSFISSNWWRNGTTRTITENDLSAIVRMGNSTDVSSGRTIRFSDIQIEEGTTPTEYEPYGYKIPVKVSNDTEEIITNVYLNQPLRKLGEYVDYIDFKKGLVIRNICEQKPIYSAIANFAKAFTTVLSKPALNTDATKRYVRCNYMTGTNRLPIASERAGTVFIGSNDSYVGFGETELFPIAGEQYPTEEELVVFKNWLDNNNVLVYYVLKTPDEETIELPNIPTTKGTTIMEAATNIPPSDIWVKYISK